jgi:hypothetical protein
MKEIKREPESSDVEIAAEQSDNYAAFLAGVRFARVNSPAPSKEWVGLTDEERHGIREWQEIQEKLGPVWAPMMLYLYIAIEAKLKEKNGG